MNNKVLLIEQSDFSFRVKKESENLKEALEIKEEGNVLLVKHVPCTILGKKNLNGRTYPAQMMQKSINEAKSKIDSKCLLCQAHDHPEGTFVRPIESSHVVVDAYIENVDGIGPVLFNDWEILPTDNGKNLASLIESGVSLGTSIRGLGNMSGSVVDSYEFLGTDVVGNPSSGTFTGMFETPASAVKVSKNQLHESEKVTAEISDLKINGKDLGEYLPAEKDSLSEDSFSDYRKVAEDLYCKIRNNLENIEEREDPLNKMTDVFSKTFNLSNKEANAILDAELSKLHGVSWLEDLMFFANKEKKKSNIDLNDTNKSLIVDQQLSCKLGESNTMSNTYDLSDLPELKQLQKGSDSIAIHAAPEEIDRPSVAVTAEETPNKGALKTGPNDHVGDAPSVEDTKKLKYQIYDANNVLAREKVKLSERCNELAQMLADSRKSLAETAGKYNEAQKLVRSLVEQLSSLKDSLKGQTPETLIEGYEKQIKEIKESNARVFAEKKEKAVKYVQNLIKESKEKFSSVASDYEKKLLVKESEINSLNIRLDESKKEKEDAEKKHSKEKEKLKAKAKEIQKESCLKVANKAADLNEKLIQESVVLIEKALEESSKVQDRLTKQIDEQKSLFEQVTKYFDIACVINESLSEVLTEECNGRCNRRRKESQARKLRGRR